MAVASTFGIVLCKLSYQQEPCPISLFEVDESSNLSLYDAFLPLVLAIYLQLEGDRELPLDIEEITKQ